jgi:hypothetical protein
MKEGVITPSEQEGEDGKEHDKSYGLRAMSGFCAAK